MFISGEVAHVFFWISIPRPFQTAVFFLSTWIILYGCTCVEQLNMLFWHFGWFFKALGSADLSNFRPAKDHTDDGGFLERAACWMCMASWLCGHHAWFMPQFFPLDVSRHVVFQVGNSLQFIQIYRWLYTSNNYAVSDCIAAFLIPNISNNFSRYNYISNYIPNISNYIPNVLHPNYI